jgi:hypothetical protein
VWCECVVLSSDSTTCILRVQAKKKAHKSYFSQSRFETKKKVQRMYKICKQIAMT